MDAKQEKLLETIADEREACLEYGIEAKLYARQRTSHQLRAAHLAWKRWQESFASMKKHLKEIP